MTDKERFVALMADFQVPLTGCLNDLAIEVATDKSLIRGYTGFSAEFTFTDDGRFVSVGIWE